MPSVVFWSGVPGGTAQYRCFTPGKALQRLGWDVAYYEDELEVTTDGRVRGDPDVLVLSRRMGDLLLEVVRATKRHGTTVIYDTDDWFLGVPDYNPASQLPREDIAGMHAAMSAADLITVSTPGLAQLYGHLGKTVVLPNYLDPEIWENVERDRAGFDGLNIGWLAAYKWRGGDLEVLRPWLGQFLDDHPEVTFGALGCPELLNDIGIQGFSTPMAAYEYLPQMLGPIDIALVPLTFNAFNWQGKSACKSLENNAMGIPAIASPSEANRAYIQPGVNGYLVRKNNWGQLIERAIDNLDELREGSRRVAQSHFIDEHAWKWVEAYDTARRTRGDLRSRRLVSAAVS